MIPLAETRIGGSVDQWIGGSTIVGLEASPNPQGNKRNGNLLEVMNLSRGYFARGTRRVGSSDFSSRRLTM